MEMEAKLYEAAESGDIKALAQLLHNNNTDLLLQVSPGGNATLHIAAYHGHFPFIQMLLRHLASSNFLRIQNLHGNTALHEAARGGDHGKIVDVLLDADPHLVGIRNNKGELPLFTAAESGRLNTIRKLLEDNFRSPPYERSDGQTPLHYGLYNQHYEVVKLLLSALPELVQRANNPLGWTPLHAAASRYGCPRDIVQKLLDIDESLCYKTDINKHQTALHMAAKKGNLNFVRCILKFGRKSVEIVDKDGRHALHLAVENAHLSVVTELAPAMSRLINTPDNHGQTALDIAVEKLHIGQYPLSERHMIIYLLQKLCAATQSVNMIDERETRSPLDQSPRQQEDMGNAISISSVLIATVTFAAAFTLPGGTELHGKNEVAAILGNNTIFKCFVLFNTLAFCSSIASATLIVYANTNSRNHTAIVRRSARLLWVALFAVLFTFALGIGMVVAPKSKNLNVAVLSMTLITVMYVLYVNEVAKTEKDTWTGGEPNFTHLLSCKVFRFLYMLEYGVLVFAVRAVGHGQWVTWTPPIFIVRFFRYLLYIYLGV